MQIYKQSVDVVVVVNSGSIKNNPLSLLKNSGDVVPMERRKIHVL